MKPIPVGILILHLAFAESAYSQTPKDLSIKLGAYTVSDDGGEKAEGIWLGTGPIVIGKAASGTFSVSDCAYPSVSSDGSLRENAYAAWKVEVTPLRVVRDAVTFRLRWIRSLGIKGFEAPNEDVELTLHPGESRMLESVPPPPGAKTFDGSPCTARAGLVRVAVDYYPSEDEDRRVVSVDLWLVERLSNGKERSQLLTIRGLPHRPLPFYFDGIVSGNLALELSGQVIARPENGQMDVSIQTHSRWGDSRGRVAKSENYVKSDEVVEVQLPKLGADAGPFANRMFSIRVRARQVR